MKKNLFDKAAANEIIERSKHLSGTSRPAWGTMNAAEMLHHCSKALQATMTNLNRPYKASTLKQKFFRFMVLNVIPRYPKGAKAPEQLDIKKSNITGLMLPSELSLFSKEVNNFCNFTGRLTNNHPYFGNLSRKQWGIITWMHLDHHLRQFGV